VKKKTYIALLAAATLWCISIVAAPLLGLSWVYSLFSRICHQDPSRSWHLAGEPLAVCIRCTSVYFGFTVSLWLGVKANVRWLRLSILLMVCEFVVARLVLDTEFLRSVSGVLVGLSAAPFVKEAIEEIRETV
jgi:uncharacterized membrane protein